MACAGHATALLVFAFILQFLWALDGLRHVGAVGVLHCPVNWTDASYMLLQTQPMDFEAFEAVGAGATDVVSSAGFPLPLWIFGVAPVGSVIPSSWMGSDFSLTLTFKSGDIAYQTTVPLNNGARALGRLQFPTASDVAYVLSSASLSFPLTSNRTWLPLTLGSFPRVRVLPATMSVVSSVRCLEFSRGNTLSPSSAPMPVVVGVPIPPIIMSVYTSQLKRYQLFNISLVVSVLLPGATVAEEVTGVTTTIVDGDAVLSNIRLHAAVGQATVIVDVPDRIKTAAYPPRAFQFSVMVSLRSAGVARLQLHSSTDACWDRSAWRGAGPCAVAVGSRMPPLVVLATDTAGQVPPSEGVVGRLGFVDSVTGRQSGGYYYAPLVGGLLSFSIPRFVLPADAVGVVVVGRIEVRGVALLTNGIAYAPASSASLGVASRLEWSGENDQFYSSGVSMVATSGVPMPSMRVFALDALGRVAVGFIGVANVTCEGRGVVIVPARGGLQVPIVDGSVDFKGVTFAAASRVACRVRVSVRSGTSMLSLFGAPGAIYPSRVSGAALSFVRHGRLSLADQRSDAPWTTGLVGSPLPLVTLLVRNSDWSIDRANAVVIVSANTSDCALSNKAAVAFGGEVQFTFLSLDCVGPSRFWFSRVGAGDSAEAALFTGIVNAVAWDVTRREGGTLGVYRLDVVLLGGGGTPLSADGGITLVAQGDVSVLRVVALGADGVPTSRGSRAVVSGSATPVVEGSGDAATLRCVLGGNGTCEAVWVPPSAVAEYSVVLCVEMGGAPSSVCATARFVAVSALTRPRVTEASVHAGRLDPHRPQSLVVRVPSLSPNTVVPATYFTPLQGALVNTSATGRILSLPTTFDGTAVYPDVSIRDASSIARDGRYSFAVELPSIGEAVVDGAVVSHRYHLSPTAFDFSPSLPEDIISVYVLARYRTFNTGQWVARLATFLQLGEGRILVSRVTDGYLLDLGVSCTIVELSFRNPTTASSVKKSAKVAREELLGYAHLCTVPEKLNIIHVKPLRDAAPFCDGVELQEMVDSSRQCENAMGRDRRCDCFIALAEALPTVCSSATLIGAVCVHLASCNDDRIQSLCAPVRPDIALQVVQVVFITAAVIVLALIVANYAFIIEFVTTSRQRLRKSRIIGPRQHHDEVFITSI